MSWFLIFISLLIRKIARVRGARAKDQETEPTNRVPVKGKGWPRGWGHDRLVAPF